MGMKIVLAHALTRHHALLRNVRTQHLFVDLSGVVEWPWFMSDRGSDYSPEAVKFARELVTSVRAFGVERVLFGSDMPVFTPSEARFLLERLPLEASERRAILVENAQRAFPAWPKACP